MGECGVVVLSVLRAWADVDGGVGELRDVMQEPMVREDGGSRARRRCPSPASTTMPDLGADAVTDPAQPQVLDVQYPGRRPDARFGRVDEVRDPRRPSAGGRCRVAAPLRTNRIATVMQQADDRVGEREPGEDAEGAERRRRGR
ncbi:MAG: hypothetical protein WKF47_18080 [Geodermatophilaceae bacterium]